VVAGVGCVLTSLLSSVACPTRVVPPPVLLLPVSSHDAGARGGAVAWCPGARVSLRRNVAPAFRACLWTPQRPSGPARGRRRTAEPPPHRAYRWGSHRPGGLPLRRRRVGHGWGQRPVGSRGRMTGGARLPCMGRSQRVRVRVPARTPPLQRLVGCADHGTRSDIVQVPSSPPPWRVAAGGFLACGVRERCAPLACRASPLAARSVPAPTPRDAAPWSVHRAWGVAEGAPQAAVPGASAPNE